MSNKTYSRDKFKYYTAALEIARFIYEIKADYFNAFIIV